MLISKKIKLSFRTKLLSIVFIIAIAFYLLNLFTYKYHASSYLSLNNLLIMLPAYALHIFSKNIKESHPGLSFTLEGLWSILLVTFIVNFFTITIQYTPFNLYDALLQQWDLKLGYNVVSVVNWFYQFPHFILLLSIAYSTNIKQLVLVPIVLALLQQRRRLDVFLNASLIAFIIGYVIYYFFPTSGPATVLTSPHFTAQMYSVPTRFYDVHHYIANNDLSGGIIALPSFHTIWAITIAYSLKNYKFVFYPFVVWNSLIIIATLALGEHFLVDVIAGIILAIVSIIIAEKKAKGKDYSFKDTIKLYQRELRKN